MITIKKATRKGDDSTTVYLLFMSISKIIIR